MKSHERGLTWALGAMTLTQKDCELAMSAMSPHQLQSFLIHVGHNLTVVGRDAYEFQAPGLTKPVLLRALNEAHHRLYSQIGSIIQDGRPSFSPESMASWLSGEGCEPEIRGAFLWAFENSLAFTNSRAQPGVQADLTVPTL